MTDLAKPLIHIQGMIGGTWTDAASGKTFAVTNPATGAEIVKIADFGEVDTDRAIASAHGAFPAWAKMLAKDRSKKIERWGELIEQNAEALAHLLTAEQGKPLAEARSEIKSAAAVVEWCAQEARRIYGDFSASHKRDARMIIAREPIGVVGAITPWNFPVSMITRKVAPALAAGCTVVLKPAEDAPLCALALADMALQAGIPAGVLNVLPCARGNVPAVGKKLCEDARVRKISFTGSTEVGRILLRLSADTIKKVSLELGGNAPFIIFDDADLDKAVDGAMISKFRNAGQTCICANRIYVQQGVFDQVVQKMEQKIKALKVGPGDADGVTMGPLINQRAVEKVQQHVTDAQGKGAQILVGGHARPGAAPFYDPTLMVQMNDTMQVAREETFGPVAALFPFKDEAEVIRRANDTIYGLATYFFTQNLARAMRVAEGLEYGMVGVNEPLLSSEMTPVGGVKQSGFGREGGRYALDDFLVMKYILLGGLG